MRGFSDFFIDRPRLVTMILIFLTIIGLTALTTLPKEATPDIVVPLSFVQVIYPGVSPEDIEQEVTNKIESALEQLKDVDYISSYISEGISVTFVNFMAGTDIDEKVRETRDEVAAIRNELPDDIEEPVVYDWSFSDSPVMVIAITSQQGTGELTSLAEDLQDKLEKISGVSQVDIVGTLEEEIHVNVDPAKLALYNISLNDITTTIKRENYNIPVGTSSVGTNKFIMRSMGKFESLDDLASVVLSANQGRVVTLSDIARVEFTSEERDSYARINGNECLNLIITKKSGENLLKTVDLVKKGMENFKKDFPPDTKYQFIGDKSWSVRKSNTDLFQNLGWGLLLVFLVLLLFLGWHSAIIITPTIPWSIFCGYLFLWWQGYSISNVVTFGAIIVLGMLVDDAIIVTENTMRHLEMGKDPDTAARDGIHEVGGAILAAGLTTFAAFGPMLFMPGITGQFIKFIPIMVISSLSGAIFIAHGFTPVFCKYFLKVEKPDNASGKLQGGWIKSLLPRYEKVLQATLKRPFLTLSIAWLLFFGAIGIVGSGMLQFELFPNSPFYKFILDINTPIGTNIEETNRIVTEVERRISTIPEVEFYSTSIGDGSDQTNLNRYSASSSDNFGTIFGDLTEEKSGRSVEEILADMREIVSDISGAEIDFIEIHMGPPEGSPIELRLQGKDFVEMERISNEVQDILAGIDGVVDITDNYNPGFPEAQIIIDRERAALSGLSNSMIGSTIRTAFEGTKAGVFYKEGDEYDIIVQFPEEKRSSMEDLRRINITNWQGKLIPFSQVADIEYTSGIASIVHRDGERTITIQADVDTTTGMNPFKAQQVYMPILKDYPLPKGYEFIFGGENEELAEEFVSLGRAMVIGLLLMYIILTIAFDSFYEPLNVMGSIPFACIGVVVGLFVTGNKFGFMPGVGIVALSGIVVNDAIVLIDHINQLRRKHGLELNEALMQGCMHRFRPVLMTSITTIVGIFPLAIGIGGGSVFWGPLGWSIIFGLFFSTFLILMIIPAFYKLSEWLFCPKFYWDDDNAFMRLVRIIMYVGYGTGIILILAAMTYFVLFTG